jgi:probable HAF family extracellular repeat protein
VVGGADLPDGRRRAFLWEHGVLTDLGTLEPLPQSEAWGINNLGQVVVNATQIGDRGRAFVWHAGSKTEVGNPSTPKEALDINDRGQIVGNTGVLPHLPRAFLFDQGVLVDLGTLGGSYSKAWEINEEGQIAGGSSTGLAEHAFLWDDGAMSDLGTLGGENSEAFGINDLGQVTGWAQPGGSLYDPFVWTSGVMQPIGPAGHHGRGESINRHGLVVVEGYLVDPVHDSAWRLEDLIPEHSGWSELSPRAINDHGQIAGVGTHGGFREAFLMTDVATSTQASVVSAEAESDRTRLEWWVATASAVTIDRREGDLDWRPVGAFRPQNDRILLEDPDVQPGRRYGYRLRWIDAGGAEVVAGEVWIDMPPRSGLALLGARPHPARLPLTIAFTLPAAGEVVLDLFDVSGRRASTSGPRHLPPGSHVLPLGGASAPGVYLARLTFGDRTLETRVVVLR